MGEFKVLSEAKKKERDWNGAVLFLFETESELVRAH